MTAGLMFVFFLIAGKQRWQRIRPESLGLIDQSCVVEHLQKATSQSADCPKGDFLRVRCPSLLQSPEPRLGCHVGDLSKRNLSKGIIDVTSTARESMSSESHLPSALAV